jgi:hypothetical protein
MLFTLLAALYSSGYPPPGGRLTENHSDQRDGLTFIMLLSDMFTLTTETGKLWTISDEKRKALAA